MGIGGADSVEGGRSGMARHLVWTSSMVSGSDAPTDQHAPVEEAHSSAQPNLQGDTPPTGSETPSSAAANSTHKLAMEESSDGPPADGTTTLESPVITSDERPPISAASLLSVAASTSAAAKGVVASESSNVLALPAASRRSKKSGSLDQPQFILDLTVQSAVGLAASNRNG